MANILKKLKQQLSIIKFKKNIVGFNQFTRRALTVKTDEEFRKLCWECVQDMAKKNKKDMKEVSLEDLYRVLSKIRKKFPKVLRTVTLYQVLNAKESLSKTSDVFNVLYGIALSTGWPFVYVGLKQAFEKAFGKQIEYAFKMYILTLITRELYRSPSSPSPTKLLNHK